MVSPDAGLVYACLTCVPLWLPKSTGEVVKHYGRRQFLDKWRMTQSTFDRFYLRRGQSLTGNEPLGEPNIEGTPGLKWALRKSE